MHPAPPSLSVRPVGVPVGGGVLGVPTAAVVVRRAIWVAVVVTSVRFGIVVSGDRGALGARAVVVALYISQHKVRGELDKTDEACLPPFIFRGPCLFVSLARV